MGRRFAYLFFLASFTCILLICCRNNVKSPHEMDAAGFSLLSRTQQVEKCGSCHKDILKNELEGPHANSYKKLMEHIEFINSSRFDQKEYAELVETAKLNCMRCHAPENLYETIFKNYSTSSDSLINLFTHQGPVFPEWRKDSASLITGVDCMSCHFDGKRVVTGKTFSVSKTDSCPSFCSPLASNLFSSNANCAPCHYDAVSGMYHLTDADEKTLSSCSSSCHQEYQNNTGTHYYWWLHDPSDKTRPVVLGGIFNGLVFSLNNTSSVLNARWNNYAIPHTMNECREITALVEVKSSDNTLLASKKIRLNRKDFHDKAALSACFKDKKVPGYRGEEFTEIAKSISSSISLPPYTGNELKISISGGHKPQYWFPDSLIEWIYEKDTILNLKNTVKEHPSKK